MSPSRHHQAYYLWHPRYASEACDVVFELRNVFVPRDKEQYDKVYVGAACPYHRLPTLLRVRREGGQSESEMGRGEERVGRVCEGRVARKGSC